MSYTFVFTAGLSVQLPMQYLTKNADGTRTPINLTGKTVAVRFVVRGAASPLLALESGAAATANGSSLQVSNAVEGRFVITVTVEEIAAMTPPCFGRAYLTLEDTTGTRELADLPFSVL